MNRKIVRTAIHQLLCMMHSRSPAASLRFCCPCSRSIIRSSHETDRPQSNDGMDTDEKVATEGTIPKVKICGDWMLFRPYLFSWKRRFAIDTCCVSDSSILLTTITCLRCLFQQKVRCWSCPWCSYFANSFPQTDFRHRSISLVDTYGNGRDPSLQNLIPTINPTTIIFVLASSPMCLHT